MDSYIPKNEPGIIKSSGLFFYESSALAKLLYNYIYWGGQYTVNAPYTVSRDYMNSFIFFAISSGSLHFEYGNQTFTATQGDVVLLDCKQKNYYYATQSATFQFFHFSGKNVQELYQQIYKQNGAKHNFPSAQAHFDEIFTLIASNQDNDFQISLKIYQLLGQLIELTKDQSQFRYSQTHNIPEEIKLTVEYIHQHFSQQITVSQLSGLANLSPYYFSRQFKKYIHSSPHNYLLNYRLLQAKQLLVTTTLSVETISERCGFNDVPHFIKSFSKSTDGITPGKFRALKL